MNEQAIPEDIFGVAYDIADSNASEDEKVRMISRALMAERERCAKIAEDHAQRMRAGPNGGWIASVGGGTADGIAAAIREPSP